jgi:hypothetical protein
MEAENRAMNTRSVARICGVLYLVTVLAYLASNFLLKGQIVDAGNVTATLARVASSPAQYRLGISIDFLAMVGVMALAFTLYVILRPFDPYLALLALGWRIGEVVLQAGAKIPDYLLLTLSQSVASSPGSGTADLVQLSQVLIAGSTRALWLSFVFLSMGSLINNYLFYKSRLIPAALAVFGLVATALYAIGSLAALVIDLPESANMPLMLPLVLLELGLGFYLAVPGAKEGVPARAQLA